MKPPLDLLIQRLKQITQQLELLEATFAQLSRRVKQEQQTEAARHSTDSNQH
jgi:prefoldin subunit 5